MSEGVSIVTRPYIASLIGSRSYINAQCDPRDNALCFDTIGGVSTLSERIVFILENCRQKDGTKWDAKALSRAAGLSPSHVNMMKNGRVMKPGGEVLAQIARAAQVSSRWLTTGEGPVTEPAAAADADDHSPRFATLLNWHVLLGTARALAPEIPAWAWETVAASHPLHTVPVTPAHVVRMARIVLELSPPPAPPAPGDGPAVSDRKTDAEALAPDKKGAK